MQDKVYNFALEMQKELIDNSHKGDWEDFIDPREILKELEYHKSKLINAMYDNEHKLIKEHIADCANLLLMLGNSYKLYEE